MPVASLLQPSLQEPPIEPHARRSMGSVRSQAGTGRQEAGRVATRAHAALLSARDRFPSEIADLHEASHPTVYTRGDRFEEEAPKGPEDPHHRERESRPPAASPVPGDYPSGRPSGGNSKNRWQPALGALLAPYLKAAIGASRRSSRCRRSGYLESTLIKIRSPVYFDVTAGRFVCYIDGFDTLLLHSENCDRPHPNHSANALRPEKSRPVFQGMRAGPFNPTSCLYHPQVYHP